MLEPPIQNKRWWSKMDLLLLFALGLFLYTPGLGNIPLFDRDEPRFASAAREMIQHHDFLVPHFNGALRPDKPPLLYWLMDASYSLIGSYNEFAARLPSAIAGTLTLLVVYLMVALRFGRFTALHASLILGTCTLFAIESRLATADATMIFFISICMACAWQAWDTADVPNVRTLYYPRFDYLPDRGPNDKNLVIDHLPKSTRRRMSWPLALIFWIALAAGALTKGVPLIFVLVPMVVLSIATGNLATRLRQWRKEFHISGARFVIAAVILAVALTIIATTASRPNAIEIFWWNTIIGLLLLLMTLTPRLPGTIYHSIFAANWSWWKQLRPAWGIPLLLAIIAAWVVPVALHSPALLQQMVGVHFLDRVAGPLLKTFHIDIPDNGGPAGNAAVNKYGKPPGFFLATVWGTFWPWSILLVPAAFHAIRRVRDKSPIAIDPRPYQFLIAWVVPVWILVELARGKLFHYSLPTFIAISILCADALTQGWNKLTDVFAAQWFAYARWGILLVWIALAAGVLVGGYRYFEPEFLSFAILFAGALLAVGVVSTIEWGRPIWPFATGLTWAVALLIASTMILPNMKAITLGKLTGAAMAQIREEYPDIHFAALGYEEGSLVFYAGDHVDMFSRPDLSHEQAINDMLDTIPFAPMRPPTEKYLLVLDNPTLSELKREHPHLVFYELRHYSGFNPGNGRPVAVTLITNTLLPKENVVPASMPATTIAPATTFPGMGR
ncbi:MAG TPA: glycosyltransferase family 39 protein [Phycisphaerae bacterium]|nr:glycosyltransferase family 39 protein [Phycisphaerae bacterium]